MFSFIKLIIIILIAIGLIYFFVSGAPDFFQSGPKEKVSKTSFKEEQPPQNKDFFDWRNIIPGDYSTKQATGTQTSYDWRNENQQKEIPDSKIPFGFTREQLSPYFQQIRISSVSQAWGWGAYTPSQIRVSASFSYSQNDSINITGWKIKSNRGEIIIPQATNIYSPLIWETEKNIILSRNNYVSIYSNTSPFNRNFRLNKCTGYLENTYDFNPSLPQDCPSIPRNEYNHLSGQCQSYIMSLGRCKLPDVSFSNSLPGTNEGNACRAFLNTISHGSCFQKYRNDADFFSNEWRVWANADILDSQHDRILLYDKTGLLVDEYSY